MALELSEKLAHYIEGRIGKVIEAKPLHSPNLTLLIVPQLSGMRRSQIERNATYRNLLGEVAALPLRDAQPGVWWYQRRSLDAGSAHRPA